MSEPPELWVFALSNVLVLALGGLLAALSLRAYLRFDRGPLGVAALGFGLITVGSLVEVVYEVGIRGSFFLTQRELLTLHSVEGVLIALGLAALFYSIRRY